MFTPGNIQGLGVDLTVHRVSEEGPEAGRPYGGWAQNGLIEILPRSCEVVVIGKNADLAVGRDGA